MKCRNYSEPTTYNDWVTSFNTIKKMFIYMYILPGLFWSLQGAPVPHEILQRKLLSTASVGVKTYFFCVPYFIWSLKIKENIWFTEFGFIVAHAHIHTHARAYAHAYIYMHMCMCKCLRIKMVILTLRYQCFLIDFQGNKWIRFLWCNIFIGKRFPTRTP